MLILQMIYESSSDEEEPRCKLLFKNSNGQTKLITNLETSDEISWLPKELEITDFSRDSDVLKASVGASDIWPEKIILRGIGGNLQRLTKVLRDDGKAGRCVFGMSEFFVLEIQASDRVLIIHRPIHKIFNSGTQLLLPLPLPRKMTENNALQPFNEPAPDLRQTSVHSSKRPRPSSPSDLPPFRPPSPPGFPPAHSTVAKLQVHQSPFCPPPGWQGAPIPRGAMAAKIGVACADVDGAASLSDSGAGVSDTLFHIASMQFALHYMFRTTARARLFFADLSSWLADGGVFIATTVDANVLIELLMSKAISKRVDARTEPNLSAPEIDKIIIDIYGGVTREKDDQVKSKIYHQRRMSNCIKNSLIDGAISRVVAQSAGTSLREGGVRILDLACGKAGDYGKWLSSVQRNGLTLRRYVGVDITDVSLKEAAKRINEANAKEDNPPQIRLALVNLGDCLMEDFPSQVWDTSVTASARSISWSPGPALVRGMGSRPAPTITSKESLPLSKHQYADSGGVQWEISIDDRPSGLNRNAEVLQKLKDGTDVHAQPLCSITFDDEVYRRILRPAGSNTADKDESLSSMAGLQYWFRLNDSSDEYAVNAPEYLVPRPLLESIAAESGFQLDFAINFQDYLGKTVNGGPAVAPELMSKMHVFDCKGTLSESEWEIIRLYQVLQFTKIGSKKAIPDKAESGKLKSEALKLVKTEMGDKFAQLSSKDKGSLVDKKYDELMGKLQCYSKKSCL